MKNLTTYDEFVNENRGMAKAAVQAALKQAGYKMKQSEFKVGAKKDGGQGFAISLNGRYIGHDDNWDKMVASFVDSIKEDPAKYGLNEGYGDSLDHEIVMAVLDVAGMYTSDANPAASQQWNSIEELAKYIKGDFIAKKWHKKFDEGVERVKKRHNIKESVNEGKGQDLADKYVSKLRLEFKKLDDTELDEFKKTITDSLGLNESTVNEASEDAYSLHRMANNVGQEVADEFLSNHKVDLELLKRAIQQRTIDKYELRDVINGTAQPSKLKKFMKEFVNESESVNEGRMPSMLYQNELRNYFSPHVYGELSDMFGKENPAPQEVQNLDNKWYRAEYTHDRNGDARIKFKVIKK